MLRFLARLLFLTMAFISVLRAEDPAVPEARGDAPARSDKIHLAKTSVVVIPVRDAIDEPVLYVIRRGLKDAIEKKADVVVLDMDTPGGRLSTTFDILEALGKFEGKTITYINKDAISAGAFITAATHDIYFAPN